MPRPIRRAFSILEVMIAISLLAVVLSAASAAIGTLVGLRRYTDETAQVLVLCKGLLERFAGAEPSLLGDATMPWSEARYYDGDIDSGSPCGSPLKGTDFVTFGLTQVPPVLSDLQIYVEYYLAEQQVDANGAVVGNPGIYDDPAGPFGGGASSAAGFRMMFADTTYGKSMRQRYWIKPSATGRIGSSVQSNTPVLVRILATRIGDPHFRQEFFTGLRF